MYEVNREKLALFLRQTRQRMTLSQLELAKLIGIYQQELSKFERSIGSKKSKALGKLLQNITSVAEITEEQFREQVEGKESAVMLTTIEKLLSLFQKIAPSQFLSSLNANDVQFLFDTQEKLNTHMVNMTPELASALLASRKHPTTL